MRTPREYPTPIIAPITAWEEDIGRPKVAKKETVAETDRTQTRDEKSSRAISSLATV